MRPGAMMHYAQSTDCRTARVLRYFGEDPTEHCGHCDAEGRERVPARAMRELVASKRDPVVLLADPMDPGLVPEG